MLIAPSILTANFGDLKNEIKSIETADYIHLDIMDGNFVPNLSFGPHITKCISKLTNIPFDTHLMVLDPLKWSISLQLEILNILHHYESNNYLGNQVKKALKQVFQLNLKLVLARLNIYLKIWT